MFALLVTFVFIAIGWCLIVRPQQQRMREQRELVAALAPGDRVITAGGIHGELVSVDDETVELRVAAGVVLTIARPAIARLVDTVGPCAIGTGRPARSHFAELARMVCYQQLAGAAARTIHGRFEALFAGPPTPEAVLALPETSLRGAGLSAAKAASIRDLAARVEATVYRDQFEAHMDKLVSDSIVVVEGNCDVDEFSGEYSLQCEDIMTLDEARNRLARAVVLNVTERELGNGFIATLQDVIESHGKGSCPVAIEYARADSRARLKLGEAWRVQLNDNLIDGLRRYLGEQQVHVEY